MATIKVTGDKNHIDTLIRENRLRVSRGYLRIEEVSDENEAVEIREKPDEIQPTAKARGRTASVKEKDDCNRSNIF